MPVTTPMNRLPHKLDEITNRILKVISSEFGIDTNELGESNNQWQMDEDFKVKLREWVEAASWSDVCNGF